MSSVVIVGASENPARFSNKAMHRLLAHDFEVLLVHPTKQVIEHRKVFSSLSKIRVPVDTVTLYVNLQVSSGLKESLIALKPRRVVFNPGTENPELQESLAEVGILVVSQCTLVMLAAGSF